MADFMLKTFYKQRDEFNRMSAERQKTLPFPEGVTEYPNISYIERSSDPAHRLDIYRPAGRENECLPVIVNVHGGGMILGHKEFNRSFCGILSTMGFLVFSLEFRLVPEVSMYEQFADISAGMDFVQSLLPTYHGDPEHIYAIGDSGGACLLTYAVAMQKSKTLAQAAKVTPSSLNIRALGLISGMFYTTKFDKIGLFLPKYFYGKNYKKSAFAPYTDPEHPDIVTSLPPCYLITSRNDHLQHYTLNYEKALERHKVPHELLNYPENPKLTHAFCVFEPFLEESKDAIEKMIAFLCKQ